MKTKKSILLAVLSVLLVCAAFTGCGKGSKKDNGSSEKKVEKSEDDSGKVSLTVWSEKNNFDAMNKCIESFKKKYEGEADFNIVLADESDGDTKNDILANVHNSADVFSIPDDQLLGLIAAGAISPVANADEVSEANIKGAVEAASYKGKLYAYPYSADNGYFLYYNKKYLKDSDVKKLDSILAVANREDKKFTMQFDTGWYLYSFFGNTGHTFELNSDGVTNTCNWNEEAGGIKGTDVAEALLKITSNPAFMSESDDKFVENAKSGKVIAGISGAWNSVGLQNAWGKDFGACKLPTYTCAGKQIQMSSFKGYKMMCVNSYSKNLKWAHKLAEWLTNEESQTIRFNELKQGPSNREVSKSPEVAKEPAIQALVAQSEYGVLQRVGNSYWDATKKFCETILEGNPYHKSLQQIMNTLVDGITKSVAE